MLTTAFYAQSKTFKSQTSTTEISKYLLTAKQPEGCHTSKFPVEVGLGAPMCHICYLPEGLLPSTQRPPVGPRDTQATQTIYRAFPFGLLRCLEF